MAETVVVDKDADTDTIGSRVYEIGYHIVPTKKEDELEGVVSAIRSMIEQAGGSFIAEGAPSLTRLSYEITIKEDGKRHDYDRGYFGWIKFEGPISAAAMLEQSLKAHRDVMRSVLFQTIREETRARFKTGSVREVKRSDVLKAAPRTEETAAPVSEADLEKAISEITNEN
ncbi:MAG TPA: 30S ribosomal protein S6 [Candidatus Paceibacterota bacterium]